MSSSQVKRVKKIAHIPEEWLSKFQESEGIEKIDFSVSGKIPRVERCPMKAGAISIKASYRFKKPDGSYEGGKVNFIPETS